MRSKSKGQPVAAGHCWKMRTSWVSAKQLPHWLAKLELRFHQALESFSVTKWELSPHSTDVFSGKSGRLSLDGSWLSRPWYYDPFPLIHKRQAMPMAPFSVTPSSKSRRKMMATLKLTFRWLMVTRQKKPEKVIIGTRPHSVSLTVYLTPAMPKLQDHSILLSLCHDPQNGSDSPASLWRLLVSRYVGNGHKKWYQCPLFKAGLSREREVSAGLWKEQKVNGCRQT